MYSEYIFLNVCDYVFGCVSRIQNKSILYKTEYRYSTCLRIIYWFKNFDLFHIMLIIFETDSPCNTCFYNIWHYIRRITTRYYITRNRTHRKCAIHESMMCYCVSHRTTFSQQTTRFKFIVLRVILFF